jgi:hypothetical protein
MAKVLKRKESSVDTARVFQEKRAVGVESKDYTQLDKILDFCKPDVALPVVPAGTVSSVTGIARKKKNKKKAKDKGISEDKGLPEDKLSSENKCSPEDKTSSKDKSSDETKTEVTINNSGEDMSIEAMLQNLSTAIQTPLPNCGSAEPKKEESPLEEEIPPTTIQEESTSSSFSDSNSSNSGSIPNSSNPTNTESNPNPESKPTSEPEPEVIDPLLAVAGYHTPEYQEQGRLLWTAGKTLPPILVTYKNLMMGLFGGLKKVKITGAHVTVFPPSTDKSLWNNLDKTSETTIARVIVVLGSPEKLIFRIERGKTDVECDFSFMKDQAIMLNYGFCNTMSARFNNSSNYVHKINPKARGIAREKNAAKRWVLIFDYVSDESIIKEEFKEVLNALRRKQGASKNATGDGVTSDNKNLDAIIAMAEKRAGVARGSTFGENKVPGENVSLSENVSLKEIKETSDEIDKALNIPSEIKLDEDICPALVSVGEVSSTIPLEETVSSGEDLTTGNIALSEETVSPLSELEEVTRTSSLEESGVFVNVLPEE